jgi:hypothetical protein
MRLFTYAHEQRMKSDFVTLSAVLASDPTE